MSLKFSIRDLLFLIAVISVACAALANTGIWWHSIVVTATLIGMTGLVIWGTLNSGSRRAFACGWLLFAAGYLMLVFGPWTGSNLGGSFITTKGLAELERRGLGDKPSPFVLNHGQEANDLDLDLGFIDIVTYNTAVLSTIPQTTIWDPSGRNWGQRVTTFHSTGHWLFASVFGYIGAHLAAFLYRRREAYGTSGSA
jgi:hypothetical protein